MSKKYFGTDGIRGKVNNDKINGEMFFKFGLAAGTYFKNIKKINTLQLLQKIQGFRGIHWNQHWYQDWLLLECMFILWVLCQQMVLRCLLKKCEPIWEL